MSDPHFVNPVSEVAKASRVQRANAARLRDSVLAQKVAAEGSEQWTEDVGVSWVFGRKGIFKELKERRPVRIHDGRMPDRVRVERASDVEELTEERGKHHPEIEADTLLHIRDSLKGTETPEEVLRLVEASFPDPLMADEAFQFLLSTSHRAEEIEIFSLAQGLLQEREARAIRAGQNIAHQTRRYASETDLGSAQDLRIMYYDITGNPRLPLDLFDELSARYDFDRMKDLLKFLMDAVGADLNAKGSSIDKVDLIRLLNEARNLQAVLGIYLFFRSKMDSIHALFGQYHILLDDELEQAITFEHLARLFVRFLKERYPTSDKVRALAKEFRLEEDDFLIQIVLFSQFRDAVRNVAPYLYRNRRHREDVLLAILDALDEIEDALEEQEQEQGDEDDQEDVREEES